MTAQYPMFIKIMPGLENLFFKKFVQTLKQEMIPLEIVDMDGKTFATATSNIRHRLLIRDPKFFKALVSPNAFSLGEAYIKGYFDVTGSIRDLYEMICNKLLQKDQPKNMITAVANLFVGKREKEKKNIEYHYDVPSPFYRLFLGKTMGYTCGYYASADATMSEAQVEKMDIVCRKLRLQPGEHLLDVGCGWGNLAVHAAGQYGVRVTGITLSAEQKAYAEDWAGRERLDHLIRIRLLNYRDLETDSYDKISCVGMSEHVGRRHMPDFYRIIFNSLKPDGLFLQHTITTTVRRKKGYENSFLDRYMFPGGELLREQDLVAMAADNGFELVNAENFRPHYVRTLGDWIRRMESRREQILDIVSEHVYRIYHVFFIGSLISFRENEIALFQNLFYKSGKKQPVSGYFLTPFSKSENRIA